MSSFQRMIAIPQDEFIHLNTMQNVQQPLQQQMKQLITEQQTFKNPYDQLVKQSSRLEEVKSVKEKIRHDLSLGTPKPYRNRALSLYRSIEPYIQFNERGELIGQDDKGIKDSRAEDLIQYAVRDRRRDFIPMAWETFLDKLRDHNVPKTFLNRQTIDELTQPPSTPPTPSRKKGLVIKPKTKRIELPKLSKQSKRKRKPSSLYPSSTFLTNY